MAALAIMFVIAGYLEEQFGGPFTALDVGLYVVFALEFTTRLAASRDRRAYLRGHLVDALALIPAIAGVRLLRVVRLLRLVRAFAGFYRALASMERMARHRSLLWLFFAWFAVALICSAALFVAESGVNPAIATPGDAAWWGVVTLTTVGYGDVFPVTTEGRLAGAALMILGITLFAAITATITSFFIVGDHEDPDPVASPASRLRELAELHRDGLVSTAEFDSKRAELLARM
jgi:voltage-gated potassium channel